MISPQDVKITSIAKSMYETYTFLDDKADHHSWDYVDEEVKENWRMIAHTALEQIRNMTLFQMDAVIEGYKHRGLMEVPAGSSFDDALIDYFNYGWTQAFDSYYDVPEEASNYHS